MGKTFGQIKELVPKKEIKISAHGYDEMAEDNIFVKDIISDVFNGVNYLRVVLTTQSF